MSELAKQIAREIDEAGMLTYGPTSSVPSRRNRVAAIIDRHLPTDAKKDWVTIGTIHSNPETEVETFTRAAPPTAKSPATDSKDAEVESRAEKPADAPDDLCINVFCVHKRDYHQPDCRFSACGCKAFQEPPTLAEAEDALRHAGIDPKDVVNGFIERLLHENAKLRATALTPEVRPSDTSDTMLKVDILLRTWCPSEKQNEIRRAINDAILDVAHEANRAHAAAPATLTDAELAEAQRLYELTTQGEWGYDSHGHIAVVNAPDDWGQTQATVDTRYEYAHTTGEWIAAAHNIFPRLIAAAATSLTCDNCAEPFASPSRYCFICYHSAREAGYFEAAAVTKREAIRDGALEEAALVCDAGANLASPPAGVEMIETTLRHAAAAIRAKKSAVTRSPVGETKETR